MTPPELLGTIYLGDRACNSIAIEGAKKRVVVHVDLISRIRSASGSWDFYDAEDIPDGRLVFEEVSRLRFDPSGPMPNSFITDCVVIAIEESSDAKPIYTFRVSIESVDDAGENTEVAVDIVARDLYLQDPRVPANAIRE